MDPRPFQQVVHLHFAQIMTFRASQWRIKGGAEGAAARGPQRFSLRKEGPALCFLSVKEGPRQGPHVSLIRPCRRGQQFWP